MANRNYNQRPNQWDWDERNERPYNDYNQQMNYGGKYNSGYNNQWEGRDYNQPMNRPYGNSSQGYSDYDRGNYDIYGSRPQQFGNAGYSEYDYNRRNEDLGGYDEGLSGRGYDYYRDVDRRQTHRDSRQINTPYSGNRVYPKDSDRSYYGEHRYRDNDRNNRRDWWDRTSDEIASWFGDEDAERRRRIDKVSGPHKGKGPKDYHRSDDRIRDDINDRLYDDSFVDASDIEVKVENGEVTLMGTADSKEVKRRAEDIAESVTGVSNVSNNIRVSKPVTAVGSTHLYNDRERRDRDERTDRW